MKIKQGLNSVITLYEEKKHVKTKVNFYLYTLLIFDLNILLYLFFSYLTETEFFIFSDLSPEVVCLIVLLQTCESC